MNIFQIASCVFKLNSCLPIQQDASLKAAGISFEYKLYDECIHFVKDQMHVSCGIAVRHDDECFYERGASAEIYVSDDIPLYGTTAFNNSSIKMTVSYQIRYYDVESYIATIAHEMSHVILYSLRSPYRHSEVATDITTMLLGFSQIFKKVTPGYLNKKQFWTAYVLIKVLQIKKKFSKFLTSPKATLISLRRFVYNMIAI